MPPPHEIEIAQTEHQAHRDAVNEAYKSTIAAGSGALRLLATINAGAIIALLGFIGALTGKGTNQPASIFIGPITSFGIGLICSTLATMGMYCAQGMFKAATENVTFHYAFPYVRKTTKSTVYLVIGRVFQFFDISLAIGSIALFIYGLILCLPILASLKL